MNTLKVALQVRLSVEDLKLFSVSGLLNLAQEDSSDFCVPPNLLSVSLLSLPASHCLSVYSS